jgi:hypothetical protein
MQNSRPKGYEPISVVRLEIGRQDQNSAARIGMRRSQPSDSSTMVSHPVLKVNQMRTMYVLGSELTYTMIT